MGSNEAEEAQRTKDRNWMQRIQRCLEILLPNIVTGTLIPRDFAAVAQWAYMALGVYKGITRDYRKTEQEMWNQYWWLKGITPMGEHLQLKDFVSVRTPTREEVQRFQEEWKWEMVHALERDPYQPVKVNKDGETISFPSTACAPNPGSTQDQAITKALSTVRPPNVSKPEFWSPWMTWMKTNDCWKLGTPGSVSSQPSAYGTENWTLTVKGTCMLKTPEPSTTLPEESRNTSSMS